MKKKISLCTIIFVILSALIAILALFGAFKITGTIANLLFTFLTLSVSGILTINSCTMLEKKNKLALISLSLISLSSLLVIIALWSNISSSNLYMELTLTACILSVCFNLIISNILKLQKKYLYIQLFSYLCFSVVSLFLILASWGSEIISNSSKLFILFLILSLLSLGILSILSKRQTDQTIDNSNFIKISKTEYNELLSIKKEYEKLRGQKND